MIKYIEFIIAFILLIVFLFFNLQNWQEAKDYKKKLELAFTQAYDLKVENKEQTFLLYTLKNESNYDLITNSSKKLIKNTDKLLKSLKDINYSKIDKIAKVIEEKSLESSYLYEDFKSVNAIVENSILWLKKAKKEELAKSKDKVDLKLISFLSDTIINYYENSFIENKEIKYEDKLFKHHIRVIYEYYERDKRLKEEYKKQNIDKDLSALINIIKTQLQSQDKTISNLMKVLFISVILFFVFAIIIYIKELINRYKSDKLKQEFQQFVDALNESAIVSKTDLLGNITYVNKKFSDVTGYTKEELMGKPHNIIRHPDMPKKVFKKLWATIKNKKIFKGTIKNRTKDGSTYYVDSVVIPLFGIDGEIVEYMAVRYEVTELIYARDSAIKAQRAKDDFLSNMSHELRTPLNSIIGFSQILIKRIEDIQEKKYIQNIYKSSKHLLTLINDILDLSKIQSGQFVLNPYSFNIKKDLNQALLQFKEQAKSVNIKYLVDIDDTADIYVDGDAIRIVQIINNLVSNALKFTPNDGVVEFKAKYIENKLQIFVKDSGIGMNQEVQDKIFQPFIQADNSTSREYGGTGLGLSITSELIKAMNGKLTLESKENEGSIFRVEIPLEQNNDVEVDTQKKDYYKKLNGHILVAEDNKTNQILIEAILEEFGLECDIADDGAMVLDMFKKKTYDLILMDENMPKLTGTQAMKIIKLKYNSKIPIIALTANNMIGDRDKFLKNGMNDFISKPIDTNELYNILLKYMK